MNSQQEDDGTKHFIEYDPETLELRCVAFTPTARYNEGMGWIEYVCEYFGEETPDVVLGLGAGLLNLYWRTNERKFVGVRICKIRSSQTREPWLVPPEDPNAPLALAQILDIMEKKDLPSADLGTFYSIARQIVGNATLAPEEWQKLLPAEAVLG